MIHGVEGVGKTSFAAQAAKPIFLMARGETGLLTLLDNNLIPPTPHFPEAASWDDLLGQVQWLIEADHDHRSLVIDTLNGSERLCHEYVCARDFNGDWGKSGFTSYQQGYDVSLADVREFLSLLDQLRDKRSMGVICLCHTKVATFKNPEGADYDRYQPDLHHKTWGLIHKWADVVCFMNFETFTEKDGQRAKGRGGQQRVLYTERHAAYDAKNRLGLPTEIALGDSAQESWQRFAAEVKARKAATNA